MTSLYAWSDLFRRLAALAGACLLCACTVTYQFAPIEAWVVDAETGKPIEGAVVTANWELVKGSLDGPRYYGQLEVKETVTDVNGRFAFDGFSKEDSSGAELRESDPQIIIFKAGYKFERFTNDYRDGGAGMTRQYRAAAVNGKRVALARSSRDPERAYTEHSMLVRTRLGFVRQVGREVQETFNCRWQQIPEMIRETRKHELALREQGIREVPSLFDYLLSASDNLEKEAAVPCISPKKLFSETAKK